MKTFTAVIERYKKMVAFGKKVARVQTRILFRVAYVVVIVPMGIMVNLTPSKKTGKGWIKAAEEKHDLDYARRQF